MHYVIYQTTNLVNNKIYIGAHKTEDLNDDYMGSGRCINRAIDKYGIENFRKDILYDFDNEEQMFAKEAELVDVEFVKRKDTYNICEGGKGGFSFINREYWSPESRLIHSKKITKMGDQQFRQTYMDSMLAGLENARSIQADKRANGWKQPATFAGRNHTEETKSKMRKPKNQGSANSQFGSMWITNGTENKRIYPPIVIPDGWRKGRVNLKS